MGETLFTEYVGNNAHTRILDLLLTGREFGYSLSEISRKANVSWTTLHRVFPDFIKHELVIVVKQVGRAKLYKANEKNPVVQKLMDFFDVLIVEEAKKHVHIREKV